MTILLLKYPRSHYFNYLIHTFFGIFNFYFQWSRQSSFQKTDFCQNKFITNGMKLLQRFSFQLNILHSLELSLTIHCRKCLNAYLVARSFVASIWWLDIQILLHKNSLSLSYLEKLISWRSLATWKDNLSLVAISLRIFQLKVVCQKRVWLSFISCDLWIIRWSRWTFT